MKNQKQEEAIMSAERALHDCIVGWREIHGHTLTFAEMVRVMTTEMAGSLSKAAQHAICAERDAGVPEAEERKIPVHKCLRCRERIEPQLGSFPRACSQKCAESYDAEHGIRYGNPTIWTQE